MVRYLFFTIGDLTYQSPLVAFGYNLPFTYPQADCWVSMIRDVAMAVIQTLQHSILFKTRKIWGQWKITYRAIASVTTNLTLQNLSKYNWITRDIHHIVGTDEWYFPALTLYDKLPEVYLASQNMYELTCIRNSDQSFVIWVKFYAHCSERYDVDVSVRVSRSVKGMSSHQTVEASCLFSTQIQRVS